MSFDEFFNNYYISTTDNDAYSIIMHPHVHCTDGFVVSVQASFFHYCMPRISIVGPYESYELGFPSVPDELINDYAEDDENLTRTVYGYVPKVIVEALIKKHGGIVIDKEYLRNFINYYRLEIANGYRVLSDALKEYA